MPVNAGGALAVIDVAAWLQTIWQFTQVLIGFSLIIFVHEAGHFIAAKWAGVRVERFAIGFTYRLFGWRRGEGFTFGPRPRYTADELRERGWGETDYCFNALPIGGYVKMMGEDDIIVDEKTGEMRFTDDPRAFTNRPVGQRMIVVSAGVVFNILFALLLFMAIYLAGRTTESPVVGGVSPDGAAAAAGIRPGDRIVAINDAPMHSFRKVIMAVVLTEGPLRFRIERDNQVLPEEIVLHPESGAERRLRTIGISAAVTTTVDEIVGDAAAREWKRGDRVTHADGRPISSAAELSALYERGRGDPIRLTIERSDPKQPNAPPQKIEIVERPHLLITDAELRPKDADRGFDTAHLLGLRPRRNVATTLPGTPAARAGFKSGDVIVSWGALANPTVGEIREYNEQNAGKPIAVTVEREGKLVELSVKPERPLRFFGKPGPATVGVGFGYGETERPIIAAVDPGTPAAALNMPRGAEILAIDATATPDWFALVNALRASAGRTVSVRFRAGAEEAVGQMTVPSSVYNELGLPATAMILKVDGQQRVDMPDGRTLRLHNQYALRELLRGRIGRTVPIEYVEHVDDTQVKTASFTVREDNIDPWQARVQFIRGDFVRFAPQRELVSAHGNPLKAVWMGVDETLTSLTDVYQGIRQLLKQNVGVENVSGPVGIIDAGMNQARLGLPDLLYFLAFLSINLAVLNFLPLPLVDGGHMVFLLIEKIKGKPLSIKTQMISMMVGLALIVLCFLYVTFQDVSRLLG